MSRKIAPMLTSLVEEYAKDENRDWVSSLWGDARRELRALLAVARAVRKGIAHTDWCGMQTGEDCCCPSQDALRAAARLNRKPRRRSGSAGRTR